MRFYYRLTTKEALVLSQSTATTNNHLGLDYIPGSAILGAIANRVYSQLSAEQSFALFHSGACRFGPAYPLVEDEVALPVPASWHGTKHDENDLSNHSAFEFQRDDETQYKQRREGYINHQLEKPIVKHGLTTRTALDKNLNVIENQLYTYTTLEAGQEFGGWIDVDSTELLDLIKPFLNSELRIGRSRSSEFGRVQMQCALEQVSAFEPKSLDKRLVIWCLSDAQCFNNLGCPTFTPAASELHPQLKGRLNAAKSFIRTRKVRRFNRARGGLDSEQQLIAAGSVLVYELDESASNDVLNTLANQAIGVNRQQGLGWINVNPAWAAQATPQGQLFEPIVLAPIFKAAFNQDYSSSLLEWVKQQVNDGVALQREDKEIQELHQVIAGAYASARAYNNLSKLYQAGPSKSQWLRLDDLAKNKSNWQKMAFDEEAGVCKAKNDELGWGLSWQAKDGMTTFAKFVKEHIDKLSSETMRRFLEQLCRFDPSTFEELKAYTKEFKKSQIEGEKV